jgi:hypothetical protein
MRTVLNERNCEFTDGLGMFYCARRKGGNATSLDMMGLVVETSVVLDTAHKIRV